MTILTEKTVFGGNSIGKIDGKTVFVPFTMPGETLEIEIIESKKDYDNAVISKIVTSSQHRVEPQCPYYKKCGGCNMMHIDYEYQQQLRATMLEDIFEQNGIDIRGKTQIVAGPQFNYRARFQINNGGLSEKGSNLIIPVENCLCAENCINEYFHSTPFEKRPQGRIHIFGSHKVTASGQNNAKTVITKNETVKKTIQVKGKTKKNLKLKENHYFAGTVASPENNVTVTLGGKNITFDVRGFFQSNLFVFEKVTKLICDCLTSGNNVLDMYAGCGSISTFLADKFKNVVLVEHNRDALVFAEQNMAGTGHVSYGLSGANWVKTCSQFCGKFDACVVDPPRSGMEKEVRDYLCNSGIPEICALSCDPATQARDCGALIKAGYNIKAAYLLDFYPNTSHIESLIVFGL